MIPELDLLNVARARTRASRQDAGATSGIEW